MLFSLRFTRQYILSNTGYLQLITENDKPIRSAKFKAATLLTGAMTLDKPF